MAMPDMRLLVVCTLGVTIAILVPTMRLRRVDFPALVAPDSAMKPIAVFAAVVDPGQQLPGGVLFGTAFGPGPRAGGFFPFDYGLYGEFGIMGRPRFFHHAIGGQGQLASLGPFLETRLGVSCPRARLIQQRPPIGEDKAPGRRQPPIEIERADDGFTGIGQNPRILAPAGARLTLCETQETPKVQAYRDFLQRLATDKAAKSAREIALGRIGVIFQQQVRDHQAQYPVTQKFKAFIAESVELRARGAAVGQRLGEQFRPREPVPQGHGQGIERPVPLLVPALFRHRLRDLAPYFTLLKIRENRVAMGHFQNCHTRALPSVEKNRTSARPTRFSAGM
jgi:hypothetical protein